MLSNAAVDRPLEIMAWRKSHRYFIERSNQDGKSEFGWDEFQAIKYRAWEHQLALTILASCFVAETRLDWMTRLARAPALLEHYEVDVLPLLVEIGFLSLRHSFGMRTDRYGRLAHQRNSSC